ncbi:uncharacterized protein [Argopecten irradians]|uniref:uncharacterized protein isoform X2 n=1 Tax=Argopecten irradians TaxID=31199 RepID=UPI00371E517D
MDPGDQCLSLNDVSMWKLDALKDFLSQRGLATKGAKDELVSLCFAAQKLSIQKLPSASEIHTQNQTGYSKLLTIDDITIKDPFQTFDGWRDEKTAISQWPPVFCSDIVKFFMSSSNVSTTEKYLNEYKVGKAYFSTSWLREVFYQPLTHDLCLLRAQCTPSQRLSNADHSAWVCVKQSTGDIKSAYCSCTAGLGQTCNHIAGLLFRVEAANKMGVTSCTSVPCSWTIPDTDKKIVQPLRVKDMELTKTKHNTKSVKKRPSIMNTTKASFNPVPSSTTSHLQPLTDQLREEIPNACIYKGLDMPKTPVVTNDTAQRLEPRTCNSSKLDMITIVETFKATQMLQPGK